jgi:hypothetical protein
LIDLAVGPGRYVVLACAAGLPALLVWRRPDQLGAAVGLSFATFLLLSPAFGMQYLVWPLAGAFLVNFWAASIYTVFVSAFIVHVYSWWNRARPWNWYEAKARVFRPEDLNMAFIAWTILLAVVITGLWLLRRPRTSTAPVLANPTTTAPPGAAALPARAD